jgi:hypothetical protein
MKPKEVTFVTDLDQSELGENPAGGSATYDVFRALGLVRPEDREKFRQLGELGRMFETTETYREECDDTTNNTAKENKDAQLEPTP